MDPNDLDICLLKYNLDIQELARQGQEVERIYFENLAQSDLQKQKYSFNNTGVSFNSYKTKRDDYLLYSTDDQQDILKYVSSRVKQAKREVTTSTRGLKQIQNFQKDDQRCYLELDGDVGDIYTVRRVQSVLNDLDIDSLAFGVTNNLTGQIKTQTMSGFNTNFSQKKDILKNLVSATQNKQLAERYKEEQRKSSFTTRYTKRIADDIKSLKNKKITDREKKWFRFKNPVYKDLDLEQHKRAKLDSILKIARLAITVFLREGGWLSSYKDYKNDRTEKIQLDWLENYKKAEIYSKRVAQASKILNNAKEIEPMNRLVIQLMENLNLKRIPEVGSENDYDNDNDYASRQDSSGEEMNIKYSRFDEDNMANEDFVLSEAHERSVDYYEKSVNIFKS